MNIRPTNSSDFDAVKRLLLQADLLVDDLDPALFQFVVAEECNTVIGCGGLEIFDRLALLRSLVVDPEHRGKRIGQSLQNSLVTQAKQQRISELYLLTETAADFFAASGYKIVDRSNAPECIQSTRQFSELCPGSATLMSKEIS